MQNCFQKFFLLVTIFGWLFLPRFAFSFSNNKQSIWPVLSSHFTIRNNPNISRVHHEIEWFLHNPKYVHKLTINARPYLYYVLQQTEKRHMPAELALLPMIESNYVPFACSKVGAVGLWQLMPGTASGYGIQMNWWYDGRRDTISSTKVALDYLAYLHQVFDNHWLLAIAAYDAGAGAVMNAIKYNQEHDRPTNFWALPLPLQTQYYVPKFLGLAYVIQHANAYHIQLSPIADQPAFSTLTINKQMNLSTIAHLADVSNNTVRRLNPAFRRFATPPGQTTTILALPVNKAGLFEADLKAKKKSDAAWIHYSVKSDDTLSAIATRFDTSVVALERVNQLRPNTLLHINQALLIPRSSTTAMPGHVIARKETINEDHMPGPKRIVHIVKPGENLWTIAQELHVTVSQIVFWNNLTYHAPLRAGQRLIAWKKHYYRRPGYHLYTVKAGDNLSMIAEHFRVSAHSIKMLNDLTTLTLQIGQQLKIP